MKKGLLRWGDGIPALLCLAVAAALLAAGLLRGHGETVRVQTPEYELVLPLHTDTERVVTGRDGLTLTVTVRDGRVCVSHADCPDQVCVATGWLQADGQSAACLPAGVILTVSGPSDPDAPDTVVR